MRKDFMGQICPFETNQETPLISKVTIQQNCSHSH